MIPNIYYLERELTSPIFAKAFAAGCGADDHFFPPGEYKPGPWAGFGSPNHWDSLIKAQEDGFDWYYGDHAYFGRGVYYKVTKNAYQHYGECDPDYNRLRPFYEAVRPWRKDGAHIVVCPQSENHHERFGQPGWLDNTLEVLRKNTDRKLIIRRKKDTRPLERDLVGAHCVITHTSNAAVEAILAGIPAVCTGLCAASQYSIQNPADVDNIIYPDGDRLKWAATLANNQWTMEEISAGKCWEKIK